MLKQNKDHFLMFDCGILDTDIFPYPDISSSEAARVDYLFLSHAHKDHTGAVSHLIQNGFQGTILASKETIQHIGLSYQKVQVLENGQKNSVNFDGFQVMTGYSGHCPGSLWFYVCFDNGQKFFYSGDFQPDPLVYKVDLPKNLKADIAIIDMAYDTVWDSASVLRDNLLDKVREYLQNGKRIILPVQAFGRGVEILYLLYKTFTDRRIWLEQSMQAMTEEILNGTSIKEELKSELWKMYCDVKRNSISDAHIVIIGDTHLERPENQKTVNTLLKGENIIGTGRRKDGSFMAEMYDANQAVKLPYPHHSSRKDALFLNESNDFKTVLPFHSNVKEIWNA